MARVMEITTPLGADVLLFHAMHAREELSRVAEYQLDLLSLKNDINLDQILGKNVTVKLALPDDSTRYFNGFVTRFSQGGMHGRYRRYSATVHPWLWFLTPHRRLPHLPGDDRSRDRREGVHRAPDGRRSRTSSTGTYRTWTYCVQYRETDLNFVSRLMEQEGIYFYFTHADGKHTLVHGRLLQRARRRSRHEPMPFIAPDDRGPAGHRAHQHLEPDARDPAGRLRARRLRFRAAERRAADAEGRVAQLHAEQLRDVRLSGRVSRRRRDGEATASVRIDEFAAAVRDGAGDDQRQGASASGALFTLDRTPARRSEPRAPGGVGDLRARVQRLRGDARARRRRLPVQLRGDVEQAAVPAARG